MLGSILVKAAFLACLASIVCYYQHHRSGSAAMLRAGRTLFFLTALLVVSIAATLLVLILNHQFQYTYIWSYSSRELTTPLLVSTFYAGQEGSFTLWTLFTTLIGIFLIRHSSGKGYEAEVMSVFGLIELSLLLMLNVKSPFLTIWESWPGQVAEGFIPANGRGLNPLLQNYWMVIHPQVLFSGFAAMGVPYAYAMAAMLKRDYRNWIRPATPWIVFAGTILGTGIMMGGFWAYETLGWGGYWGWDPVENSSLVPWLVAVASLHTILSQRRSGAFIRTNIILGMLCFLMVLYSTFLTRSGVLGETSVHSFVDPGMWAYWLLVGMLALFTGLGIGMLVSRWKDMPKTPARHSIYSREFALFLGASALVVSAILVSIGTSSPLITDILYGKKSAVETSYYTTTMLPLGIIITLLAGLGQLLWWTRSDKRVFLRSLMVPAVLSAIVATSLSLTVGVEPLVGFLLFGAGFSLFANLEVGWRIMKGNPKFAGGAVAHVGLAIMIFGFVASSKYDRKETLSLPQGRPVKTMGYTLTYVGYQPIDKERYAFTVNVEKGDRQFSVAPIMYYTSYNDGLMRNPDILNLVTRDLYVAPLSLEQKDDASVGLTTMDFKKGETKKIGNLDVRFLDYDFPEDQKEAMMEGRDVRIGAKLEIREGGRKAAVVTPVKLIRQGQTSDQPAQYGNRYEFTISAMSPDREAQENSRVTLGVRDLSVSRAASAQADVLVAEATVKPFINLVWSGLIVVIVGFLVTIVRRSRETTVIPPG